MMVFIDGQVVIGTPDEINKILDIKRIRAIETKGTWQSSHLLEEPK